MLKKMNISQFFYEQLGFKATPNKICGAGMMKVVPNVDL